MYADPRVGVALSLCDLKGRFLYEVLPDLFPPRLTDAEAALWGRYYEDQARRRRR